jgi:hypothetical protein
LNVDVLATIDERDQTNDLESEEKRIVRGATPEEEKLKAKQLNDTAHAEETLQGNYKFASKKTGGETLWRVSGFLAIFFAAPVRLDPGFASGSRE